MNITVYADGYLKAGNKICRAAYGQHGIGLKIREGDRISPEGTWPLRRLFYRPDRLSKPTTSLDVDALTPSHAWCDVVGDPNYNKLVMLPYSVLDETLWRDDNLYDIIIVLGYNDDPIIDGKGSAIFLHAARADYSPSAGCAAVSIADLMDIIPKLATHSSLTFTKELLKGEAVRWPYLAPTIK